MQLLGKLSADRLDEKSKGVFSIKYCSFVPLKQQTLETAA